MSEDKQANLNPIQRALVLYRELGELCSSRRNKMEACLNMALQAEESGNEGLALQYLMDAETHETSLYGLASGLAFSMQNLPVAFSHGE